MQQVFRIEGMHCAGCVSRVSKALALQAVQAALQKAGDYHATEAN